MLAFFYIIFKICRFRHMKHFCEIEFGTTKLQNQVYLRLYFFQRGFCSLSKEANVDFYKKKIGGAGVVETKSHVGGFWGSSPRKAKVQFRRQMVHSGGAFPPPPPTDNGRGAHGIPPPDACVRHCSPPVVI